MFNVFKEVLAAGGYKLSEIQHKIKKLYVFGDLNESQMDELLAMAAAGVSTDAERPAVLEMLRSLAAEIEALKVRVNALSGSGAEDTNPEQPAYERWEPWDGISDKYQYGAVVEHKDEIWESTFKGQNVWEPGTPGTENFWKKYNG